MISAGMQLCAGWWRCYTASRPTQVDISGQQVQCVTYIAC